MIRLLLPLLLAMLAGCAKPASVTSTWMSPTPGTMLSAEGTEVNDARMLELAGRADFVLVGESHTNLCDHTIQARIIELLAASGRRFTIGLEMLPVTAQPVLDRFNTGLIPVDGLEQAVQWRTSWGYPFSQYKPVFELARQYDLPVVALNLPRTTLSAFKAGGRARLSEADRAQLPSRIIEPSPAQKKALAEQFALHQTMRRMTAGNSTEASAQTTAPAMAMEAMFFTAQALWDSVMAEQALRCRQRNDQPVLILAGTGHVEHGWGIEYRLRTYAPRSRCLAVIPVRDETDWRDQTDDNLRAQPGTALYFFCPAQHTSRLGMNIIFAESMRIESVEAGSRADTAGLRAGDILLEAGGAELKDATDLHFAAMKAARNNTPLRLSVRRASRTITLDLNLR